MNHPSEKPGYRDLGTDLPRHAPDFYKPLPHVTDVDLAMRPDAPVVQSGRSLESVPAGMSANVTHHSEFGHGDLEAGFAIGGADGETVTL